MARCVLVPTVLSLFAGLGCAPEEPESSSGIVVESVRAGLAAARAGIESGDVLLSWSVGAEAQVELSSPIDLREVEIEYALRKPVVLSLQRGARRLRLELPVGEWGIELRPRLDPETLRGYRAGRAPRTG